MRRAWAPFVLALIALSAVISWWMSSTPSRREASLSPDKLEARLARDCPCTDAANGPIPDVGVFAHIKSLIDENSPGINLGPEIPADELPLALLYRAIDDGAACGEKLTLVRATRRADLHRSFLRFGVEWDLHSQRLYVIDDLHDRICCKGEIDTRLRGTDVIKPEDVPPNADK